MSNINALQTALRERDEALRVNHELRRDLAGTVKSCDEARRLLAEAVVLLRLYTTPRIFGQRMAGTIPYAVCELAMADHKAARTFLSRLPEGR